MMTKLRTLGLVLCVGLASAPPAHADVVTDWNAVTVLYVSTGGPGTPQVPPVGRGGPPGLLDIALVHLAMHDAVQAIERKFEPYHYSNRKAFGVGNPAAAAAAAAHRVLVLLYPGQQGPLDILYGTRERPATLRGRGCSRSHRTIQTTHLVRTVSPVRLRRC